MKTASHEMLFLVLQTLKMGGHFCILHGKRDALETCQCKRAVFLVAGAALSADAFCNFVAGAALCDVAKAMSKAFSKASQKSYVLSSVKITLKEKNRRKSSIFTFQSMKSGGSLDERRSVGVLLCSTL